MPIEQAERRFLSLDQARIERRMIGDQPDDTRPPTISGYALVFFNADDPDGTQFELGPDILERFLPGCCDETIRTDDVRCLFNHDPNYPIGRTTAGTMRLTVDAHGCRYETDLPDSPVGHTVAAAIARRDVTGSSVGMEVLERTIREDGDQVIREISRIRLYDASPVTFPAYAATSTEIARRSIDEFQRERDAQRLREERRKRRIRSWLFTSRTAAR